MQRSPSSPAPSLRVPLSRATNFMFVFGGGRAAVEDAHAVDAVILRLRVVEQGDVDRGHGGEVCGAVVAYRREQRLDVVLWGEHPPDAAPHPLYQADREAVDVEERDHQQ